MKEEKKDVYSSLEIFNPISVKEEIRDDTENIIVKEEPDEFYIPSDSSLVEGEDVTVESQFLDEVYDIFLNEENNESTEEVYFGIRNIFTSEEDELPFSVSRKNASRKNNRKPVAISNAKRSFAMGKTQKSKKIKIKSIIDYKDNRSISNNLAQEHLPKFTTFSTVKQIKNEKICIKSGSTTAECNEVVKLQESEKDLEEKDGIKCMEKREIELQNNLNLREYEAGLKTGPEREIADMKEIKSLKMEKLGFAQEEKKEPNEFDSRNEKKFEWKSEKKIQIDDTKMLEIDSKEKKLSWDDEEKMKRIKKIMEEKPRNQNRELKTKRKNKIKNENCAKIDKKRYECSQCSYSGKTRSLLKRHMMSHLPVKRFQCSECCYSTMFNSYLQEHLVIHSNLRPFQCSYCSFASKLKSNLKKHEKTHRNSNLQKHEKTHRKSNFQKHEKTHRKVTLRSTRKLSEKVTLRSTRKLTEKVTLRSTRKLTDSL